MTKKNIITFCRKVNIENSIEKEQVPMLLHFVRFLREAMHALAPDSLNRLNARNRAFFLAADGLFTNYSWPIDSGAPGECATSAGGRRADVYMGIDVVLDPNRAGWGFDSGRPLRAAWAAGVSAALFAPAWVYENKQLAPFEGAQERPYPTRLPLFSSFNQVSAAGWNNMSWQSLQLYRRQLCGRQLEGFLKRRRCRAMDANPNAGSSRATTPQECGKSQRLSLSPPRTTYEPKPQPGPEPVPGPVGQAFNGGAALRCAGRLRPGERRQVALYRPRIAVVDEELHASYSAGAHNLTSLGPPPLALPPQLAYPTAVAIWRHQKYHVREYCISVKGWTVTAVSAMLSRALAAATCPSLDALETRLCSSATPGGNGPEAASGDTPAANKEQQQQQQEQEKAQQEDDGEEEEEEDFPEEGEACEALLGGVRIASTRCDECAESARVGSLALTDPLVAREDDGTRVLSVTLYWSISPISGGGAGGGGAGVRAWSGAEREPAAAPVPVPGGEGRFGVPPVGLAGGGSHGITLCRGCGVLYWEVYAWQEGAPSLGSARRPRSNKVETKVAKGGNDDDVSSARSWSIGPEGGGDARWLGVAMVDRYRVCKMRVDKAWGGVAFGVQAVLKCGARGRLRQMAISDTFWFSV
eukprot:jgi/Mesen1/10293/ME000079S09714